MAGALTTSEFRSTLALFATGVSVVTARSAGHVHGMTANAFTSVSLDPMLVLLCVERGAVMHKAIEEAGTYAVSVLGDDQEALARYFSDSARPPGLAQFEDLDCRPGPVTGAPLLAGALAWVEARVLHALEGGDHSVFLAEVLSLQRAARRDPLLFFAGGYRSLGR